MVNVKNDQMISLISLPIVAGAFWIFVATPSQGYTCTTVSSSYRDIPLLKSHKTAQLSPVPLTRTHHSSVTSILLLKMNDDRRVEDITAQVDDSVPITRIDAVRKMLQTNEGGDIQGTSLTNGRNDFSMEEINRRNLLINVVAGGLLVACGIASSQLFLTNVYTPTGFQRLPSIQFIAAVGDPNASSGKFNPNDISSSAWGLWKNDPGPRGVWLRDYDKLFDQPNPVAPAGWTFDGEDWWLEEHGIIMEQPTFPIKPGRYLVTGGRSVTTGLSIDKNGNWKLDEGTLYDVTHLPCRSARYRPQNGVDSSPKQADFSNFPVRPGAVMPSVPGYSKQDYAVLFLVGVAS